MRDKTEIFNSILLRASTRLRVASWDEDSDTAERVRLVYESSRQSLLESANWQFAIVVALLERIPEDTIDGADRSSWIAEGWNEVYKCPENFLRPVRLSYSVRGTGDWIHPPSYRLQSIKVNQVLQNVIVARDWWLIASENTNGENDQTNLWLRYVSSDTALPAPEIFLNLLILEAAIRIVPEISTDRQLIYNLRAERERAEMKARAFNAETDR